MRRPDPQGVKLHSSYVGVRTVQGHTASPFPCPHHSSPATRPWALLSLPLAWPPPAPNTPLPIRSICPCCLLIPHPGSKKTQVSTLWLGV